MSQSAYRRVCGAATPKPPVAIERVTPHGCPDAARGVQPSLRGLDGETPSCAGLCGGRTHHFIFRHPSPVVVADTRAGIRVAHLDVPELVAGDKAAPALQASRPVHVDL